MELGFLVGPLFAEMTSEEMAFSAGNLKVWKTDAEGVWRLVKKDQYQGDSGYVVLSDGKGEKGTGVLKSEPFEICKEMLELYRRIRWQ